MSSAVADVPTAADAQTSAFAAAEVAAAAVLLASTAAAVHVLLLPLRPFMCCFYCCGRSCVASTVAAVHVLLLLLRSFICWPGLLLQALRCVHLQQPLGARRMRNVRQCKAYRQHCTAPDSYVSLSAPRPCPVVHHHIAASLSEYGTASSAHVPCAALPAELS